MAEPHASSAEAAPPSVPADAQPTDKKLAELFASTYVDDLTYCSDVQPSLLLETSTAYFAEVDRLPTLPLTTAELAQCDLGTLDLPVDPLFRYGSRVKLLRSANAPGEKLSPFYMPMIIRSCFGEVSEEITAFLRCTSKRKVKPPKFLVTGPPGFGKSHALLYEVTARRQRGAIVIYISDCRPWSEYDPISALFNAIAVAFTPIPGASKTILALRDRLMPEKDSWEKQRAVSGALQPLWDQVGHRQLLLVIDQVEEIPQDKRDTFPYSLAAGKGLLPGSDQPAVASCLSPYTSAEFTQHFGPSNVIWPLISETPNLDDVLAKIRHLTGMVPMEVALLVRRITYTREQLRQGKGVVDLTQAIENWQRMREENFVARFDQFRKSHPSLQPMTNALICLRAGVSLDVMAQEYDHRLVFKTTSPGTDHFVLQAITPIARDVLLTFYDLVIEDHVKQASFGFILRNQPCDYFIKNAVIKVYIQEELQRLCKPTSSVITLQLRRPSGELTDADDAQLTLTIDCSSCWIPLLDLDDPRSIDCWPADSNQSIFHTPFDPSTSSSKVDLIYWDLSHRTLYGFRITLDASKESFDESGTSGFGAELEQEWRNEIPTIEKFVFIWLVPARSPHNQASSKTACVCALESLREHLPFL